MIDKEFEDMRKFLVWEKWDYSIKNTSFVHDFFIAQFTAEAYQFSLIARSWKKQTKWSSGSGWGSCQLSPVGH